MNRHTLKYIFLALIIILSGCSSTKHLPEGELLLDKTKIVIENGNLPEGEKLSPVDFQPYLRQTPNTRVLGFLKLQLATYNLAGKDSTKRFNKWLKKIGQPPVIYDSLRTQQSMRQLQLAMINRGYNDAIVKVDTVTDRRKRKMSVRYTISPGTPHRIKSVRRIFEDPALEYAVMSDSIRFLSVPGALLDRNILEQERVAITSRLRNKGYYSFSKEFITFTVDTVRGKKEVDVTMTIRDYSKPDESPGGEKTIHDIIPHRKYMINKVYAVTNYNPVTTPPTGPFECEDTVSFKGITMLYGEDRYLRPSIIEEKCFIEPGKPYVAAEVDHTYESLSQLGILKYVNIIIKEDSVATKGDTGLLNVYILMQRANKQGVTLELEGTNSEGDLGFGVGVTYRHRNLWKGSELLTAKFRTAYESISGNLDGFINHRYTEYAGEIGLTFPKFEGPFLPKEFKRKSRAVSEVALSFNYQERPEYTRVIAGAAWRYKWNSRNSMVRHTFDLVDANFVYLPHSTIDFLDQIAPTNPLLRYSYEDHFIMRMAYTFSKTNKRIPQNNTKIGTFAPRQRNLFSFRFAAETAGNLLYAISCLDGQHRTDGAFRIFGIQYSQYAKAEADYTFTLSPDTRNSIAFHIGGGIACPYGNSAMVPFEKRFYAGGANGVRGWSVRTLGPGSYDSKNSVTDFINQCGDIRLDMSVEYRARLFWVLESALFVDAGNIWTIRDYDNQPGGFFRFNKFYKQLAAAYGVGLRLDFTYFLVRFDLGMKAHNPAMNSEPWPIVNPDWKRDATFHFAVGYPF